ncbi:URIDINE PHOSPHORYLASE [Ceraceosorus bombacis]|uniref:URIDINE PHOSPHORYLASE n=1 Tax=Ceraceosorus bombacis TaxID=401625 RepID=A0A0N7LAA2_9BASI|nr:URIDINE PHOSPHORYLASE [Ceraceosorus bombacis]
MPLVESRSQWEIIHELDALRPISTGRLCSRLTITGLFKGVPITVVSIGMGFSLVDFFIREVRAILQGDMFVVRLGSCGSLSQNAPIGSVVVPLQSVGVLQNYDAFLEDAASPDADAARCYHITKPLPADAVLHKALVDALNAGLPPAQDSVFGGRQASVVGNLVNASTDSFYSSQGRTTSFFEDRNSALIERIQAHDVSTFEMETYLLSHLARSHNRAVHTATDGEMRVAAAQIVFANRTTAAFVTPAEVEVLERWAGGAVCEALVAAEISAERLHPKGVWSRE